MKQAVIIALIGALCAGIFLYVYTAQVANAPHDEQVGEKNATTTATGTPETVMQIVPYGEVTLAVGSWGVFQDVRIRPLRIVEDSRCPSDVTCIQAGTVRVELETVSGLGTSTDVLALGATLTTEAEAVTLSDVTPAANSQRAISSDDYRLTFSVEKRVVNTLPQPDPRPVSMGACYVGGCSSQLCSDTPDMVSTCEYREEYGCYQHATCERQTNGQCGWTPNATFNACMLNAQATVYPQ